MDIITKKNIQINKNKYRYFEIKNRFGESGGVVTL
jgi:hypothetical protein